MLMGAGSAWYPRRRLCDEELAWAAIILAALCFYDNVEALLTSRHLEDTVLADELSNA